MNQFNWYNQLSQSIVLIEWINSLIHSIDHFNLFQIWTSNQRTSNWTIQFQWKNIELFKELLYKRTLIFELLNQRTFHWNISFRKQKFCFLFKKSLSKRFHWFNFIDGNLNGEMSMSIGINISVSKSQVIKWVSNPKPKPKPTVNYTRSYTKSLSNFCGPEITPLESPDSRDSINGIQSIGFIHESSFHSLNYSMFLLINTT